MKLDVEGAECDIVTGTRLDTFRRLRHAVAEYRPVPDREFAAPFERPAKVGLAFTKWERCPQFRRGVCWLATLPGAP